MKTEKQRLTDNNIILLLDGSRGIYIPQQFGLHFLRTYGDSWRYEGVNRKIILDPEREDYWESWEEILDSTVMIDHLGRRYALFHNGDLFAYALDAIDTDEVTSLFDA